MATNYAVIVSIGEYKYQPDLAFANTDAALMCLTIQSQKLGSIHDENIYYLVNEQATAENIELILSYLSVKLLEQDQLIIYYSGHGYIG